MQRAKPAAEEEMRTMVRAKRAPDPVTKAAAGEGEEATLVRRAPAAAAPKVEPATRPPAPSPSPARGSPPPAKPAVPVPAVLESAQLRADDLAPDDAERTAAVGSPDLEPALMQATLGEAKPRLVFRAKKQGSVVPVTEPANVIGRKQVGDVTIAIDDDGVSSRHARLTLAGRSFWIEDLGSKNHTLLDKEQIAPRVKRVLHGDCCLRFGTVDVLLVVEPVAGMESPDGATYDEALGFLAESGVLAGESLKRAQAARREGKHPAQELIVAGVISVSQWHDAITTAKLRVRANVPSRRKGSKQTLIVGALIVLVLILVAVVIWLAKSGK
jgi:pSer/pThr/pTyr-binding forkhead associated (FHA) protein